MEFFGAPAAARAAGTYMMLLVKTVKHIRPFSEFDGITGPNEEEFLVDFNTAFKVVLAAVRADHSMMTYARSIARGCGD
jgi:hypothetical protein